MKCSLTSTSYSRGLRVSNLPNVFGADGCISTMEMWPRHSACTRRTTGDRIPHKAIEENEELFEELYSILLEHPMSTTEWNKRTLSRRRAAHITELHLLLPFEYWVSEVHPGHMPYLTERSEMGLAEWLCWRRCGTRHKTHKKTRFICLLGISYNP